MTEQRESIANEPEEDRAGRTWPFLLAMGAAAGAAGALLQLRMLRFGGVGADQALLFWGFFLIAGVLLTLIGGALVRLVFARENVSRALRVGAALVVPVVVLAIFLPWNRQPRPNVLLLVTDATRADHLSVYGYDRDTTPFLREMPSIRFTNMVSTGSHTIVTTPCILASCYPSEHGIRGYSDVLSDRFTLISEYLKGAGYATYAYATNPHIRPGVGFGQGFDTFGHDPGWRNTPAGMVNDKFLEWLDNQTVRPFFAFHFYVDPHNPYLSPPEFQRLFDPEWESGPVSDWKHELGEPEPRTLFNLLAQYDGSIAYWDAELRRLVGELERRGEYRNTLLVYTSDHGEEFWEHGEWGHQRTLFEESIHVPLILSIPSPVRFPPLGRTSRTVEEVASSVDIVPTILDIVRIEPDGNVRGSSLLRLALGGRESGPERRAYCEEILNQYGPYDMRGLRSKDRKYVMTFTYEGARDLDDGFYDLLRDPEETRNAIRDLAEEAAEHRKMLAALVREISGRAPARVDTVEIDPATREGLRALGYLN
ncbi:MAG: sulfatase-like hydrolase/transferase [Candidatus Eisenbacteria bacterium]|nr:sulfatase-like hydrolase/transferase [Candidatus Eisenbacteria bacterium]